MSKPEASWKSLGSIMLGGLEKKIDAEVSKPYRPRDDQVYTSTGGGAPAQPVGTPKQGLADMLSRQWMAPALMVALLLVVVLVVMRKRR